MRFCALCITAALFAGFPSQGGAQQTGTVITVERFPCFGACPAYLLRLESSGVVSFQLGVRSNRFQEQISAIPPAKFDELVTEFAKIGFFELEDVYPLHASDLPEAEIELNLNGKVKRIHHGPGDPQELEELERRIERVANVHHWLHDDHKRYRLPPGADSYLPEGEDLKNESRVREDVYRRIKPGMTPLMQAAGRGDTAGIREGLNAGGDVNAADETGWTALMDASVSVQPDSVSALLKAGARANQRDNHGDSALIGAASVRFGNSVGAAWIVEDLISNGAEVDAVNDLGQSALMWAARAGNALAVKMLLKAGANPERTDRSGHNALYYLHA